MERKGKHLEFIQGTVNRLSTNSFLLKGWSVVLVSALFALAAADFSQCYVKRRLPIKFRMSIHHKACGRHLIIKCG